jgi:hypothetical protein
MAASRFWSTIGQGAIKYGLPGFGGAFLDDQASRSSERAQVASGDAARGYAEQALNYTRDQNAPLIAMGDQQLNALRAGVESGAFGMDESIFNDYQQYVAPQYNPGGKFQYEPRDSLVTPEMFQYAVSNPEKFQYDQQAPAPFSYSDGQQNGNTQNENEINPTTGYPRNYQQLDNGKVMPPSTMDQLSQQQQQKNIQQSGFNQQQPELLKYQSYQNNLQAPGNIQAPQQLQRTDFQYNQQAPQFNPIQNFGQAPQLYRSGDAPQGQYVQPQQQHQSREFSLQNDPVYQKALSDANMATEASAAARGIQLSGSNLKALQQNAGDIAAQQGEAAFNRHQQQDATNYGRFQDQRADLKDTTRYQTEDQYRRFLDSQNIRGADADRAVAQWNTDRSFLQNANVQNFQVGNDAYQQGFRNAADVQQMNDASRLAYGAENWNQQLGAQRQNFDQYGQMRNMNSGDFNMNAGNQLAFNAQNLGQYNTNRNFSQGVQGQNFDQYATLRGMAGQENQQNFNQFANNRDFAANQYQQGVNNNLDFYNVNNANYQNDRDFDYGVNQDFNSNNFDAFKYNVGNNQLQDATNYAQLTDSYGRQAANKQNKYGMIGDLANMGMAARQQNVDATTGYYGNVADIGMQQANARAAATASRQGKSGILGLVGL